MKLILGSQSIDRARVLKELGLNYEIIKPGIDEKAIRFSDPNKLTLALAHAKADKILKMVNEPCFIVTADQVVSCNGKIIEKPEDAEEVKNRFCEYEKFPVQTINGVVVTNSVTGKRCEGIDFSTVIFKHVPESIVEQIANDESTYTRAGGFTVEDERLKPYIKITEGTVDSIIGMPKNLLRNLLNEAGYA